MKKLTEEQKNKLRKVGMKFVLKSSFNGMQHGVMAILMNFILTLANIEFFENDNFVQIIGCVIIMIFVFKRVSACQRENVEDFKKIVKEITE